MVFLIFSPILVIQQDSMDDSFSSHHNEGKTIKIIMSMLIHYINDEPEA